MCVGYPGGMRVAKRKKNFKAAEVGLWLGPTITLLLSHHRAGPNIDL